jgi:hypothetical protein
LRQLVGVRAIVSSGSKQFKTDCKINNTAYEVHLRGVEVNKEEYDKL